MSDKYSLVELMKNDFCFESLKKAKEDTKKFKSSLDSSSKSYNDKYKDRIEKENLKRQLLLEDAGIEDGSPEAEEFFRYRNDQFYLTKNTPILNFLYLLNEEFDEVESKFESLKEEYEQKYGDLIHENVDTSVLKNDMAKKLEQVAQGSDYLTDDFDTGDNVPHMEKYIYRNMDAGTFGKLKKLKALSMSDNEQEAKAAWIKCMDICDRFGLSFDDIPTKYD